MSLGSESAYARRRGFHPLICLTLLSSAGLAAGDSSAQAVESHCEPQWLPAFGGEGGVDDTVRAFAIFDDGSGPALYAGGLFSTAGGDTAIRVARWDGTAWSPLGSGVGGGNVLALQVFDDGSGPALFAAGSFTTAGGVEANRIAKWDGTAWSPLGSGMAGGNVAAMEVFDDGSGNGEALYAGGTFTSANGRAANFIAKWDGMEWSDVGGGVSDGVFSNGIRALAVFDDGDGPALYAGGFFTTAGGASASRIARWDGHAWSPLGGGITGPGAPWVWDLAVFDDGSGSGPELYAGGLFSQAGGSPADNIARWNGSTWSPVGSGMNGSIRTLVVFDDGAGPALYAAGAFSQAGATSANRIARWDGSVWSPLASGLSTTVWGSTVFDDGSGSALYVGGEFTSSPAGDQYIAKWGRPKPIGPADLNCDGVVDGADLGLLLGSWGPCRGCPADLNGDGVVDGADLGLLLGAWGS